MMCAGKTILILFICLVLPGITQAQGLANEMKGLHGVLDQLYDQMMPLCSQLIGIAQGIAGFGALWYIGARVWRHIANAEPIDFYPLFRPFVLGFAIMIFPSVLGIINGIMKPTVTGTAMMVEGTDLAISRLLKEKERQVRNSDSWKMYVGSKGNGDRKEWYKYTYEADPEKESLLGGIGNDLRFAYEKASYNFRNSVKEWLSEALQILYVAASLCINTLRTFNLIVLAILGPISFGLAVFDGFQNSLSSWLARYINIFLWLPVANIFGSIIGKVQENMLALDISEIQNNGDTLFSSTDTGYLVFLIIGIVGYFTVPTVAGYIVNTGGGGAMVQKITSILSSTAASPMSVAGSTISATRSAIDAKQSYDAGKNHGGGTGFSGAMGRLNAQKSADSYQHDKLSGNA